MFKFNIYDVFLIYVEPDPEDVAPQYRRRHPMGRRQIGQPAVRQFPPRPDLLVDRKRVLPRVAVREQEGLEVTLPRRPLERDPDQAVLTRPLDDERNGHRGTHLGDH